MQIFAPITDAVKLNDWPEMSMANFNTLMSNSSGTAFPTSNTLGGMSCYREDQGKLYVLFDKATNDWRMIADLGKTYQSKEDADAVYLPKASVTSSLTDGSTSKAASASAAKTLKTSIDSHISAYGTFTAALQRSGGYYSFSDNVKVSKDLPILKLRSSTSGSNTVEKAAALMMGSTDAKSFTFTVDGTGAAHIGLGALTTSNLPTTKVMKIAAGQSGVQLFGALSGTSATFSSNLDVSGAFTANTVVTSGSVTANGGVYSVSDRSTKTNIHTIENALSTVLSARGVYYTSLIDGSESVGVVADEMELVEKRAVKTVGRIKTVAYGNLVGLLIEAIKELNSKVEANAAV